MADDSRDLQHLFPLPTQTKESYTHPGGGGGRVALLERDRRQHANDLESQLRLALQERKDLIAQDEEAAKSDGFYLEFRLVNSKGAEKALDQLESLSGPYKIELMSVREDGEQLVAAVYVPDEKQEHYLKKVEDYATKDTKTGKPQNAPLISRVEQISFGRVESLYYGKLPLPEPHQDVWWEAWIIRGVEESFRTLLAAHRLETPGETISFLERDVVLVKASVEQLERLLQVSRYIAELRLHSETPYTFLQMSPREQREWAEDLSTSRLRVTS